MWTAISLAVAYAAIFAIYAAWAFTRIGSGASPWPFVVALPLVYAAVPFTFVCLWFVVAWLFRADRPADARLRFRQALRLFWNEFATIAGNSPRMIAFRRLVRDPPPAPCELPVLLLHGVMCNAGVWHPFLRWFRQHGIGSVYALSYGPPLASIDVFADQAAAKIDAILAETGARQVIVVAHSMGGLVMRAYFRRHGGSKVARLITIATPHAGSMHAWLALGQSVSQLRPRNAWLAELGEPEGDDLPPMVSVWSWHDSMVAPQTSSRVPFADNVEVTGVGHTAMLRDREVFARVLREIRAARATSGSPA
jgi:pimeloyl-ACP methyl ester carboxylesterase